MKKMLAIMMIALLCCAFIYSNGQNEEAPEKIKLVVWDFKYGEVNGAGPVMQEMDELFMEQNPNIIIEHVAQPSRDAYYNLISTSAASQQGPDVFMVHGGSKAWQYDEVQVKLDDYIASWRDKINPASWQFGATDNDLSKGIKTVPLTSQGFGIYYNKELFRKAGLDPENPPVEFDDFMEACEKLHAAGIKPFLVPNTPPITTEFAERNIVLNFFSDEELKGLKDGSTKMTDPKMKEAIAAVKKFMSSDFIAEEDKSWHLFKEGIPAFKAGEGAMFWGLLSDIACWKDFSDALGKDNVGYFPNINLPNNKYDNRQSFQPIGIGYSVATWCEHKEAAVKYLEFCSAGDGAYLFASKLGALVPSSSIDLSDLGYTCFETIQNALGNSAVDFQNYVAKAASDINLYRELFYNTNDFDIDEYTQNCQNAIEEMYMK